MALLSDDQVFVIREGLSPISKSIGPTVFFCIICQLAQIFRQASLTTSRYGARIGVLQNQRSLSVPEYLLCRVPGFKVSLVCRPLQSAKPRGHRSGRISLQLLKGVDVLICCLLIDGLGRQ